jgi:hypothetical protein
MGIARVKADRNDACISAYETLIEKAGTSNVHAGPSVVFASENGRRMVVMVGVRGHEGFRHLASAWDDHHRNEQHRVIAESVSFALFEVSAATGTPEVDPSSHDAYVFERVERAVPRVNDLFASLGASLEFRGATVFHDDGAGTPATVMLSRFAHVAAYDVFRTSRDAVNVLGSAAESGDTVFAVRPRKTIALARQ